MKTRFETAPITRRDLLARGAGAGAALSLGTLTLSVSRGAHAARDITFITPFGYLIGFTPVLYAVSGGFLAKEGLNVTVQGGKGSAMAVQQVLSGRAQFSRTGGVDVMKAAGAQGAPIKAIATVTQASPMFMISNTKAPIDKPEDMKGKTIGVTSKGGLAENLLNMTLEDNGIAADTINREAVGNAPGAFALIEQGRIDAYIASMGTVVALRRAKQPIHAWNTDRYAPIPGQVYTASNDTIANDPDTVTAFLRGVNGSMQAIFAAKDLQPVLESIGGAFKVRGMKDMKEAEEALRAEMDLYAAEGRENLLRNVPARWQRAHDLMAKVGLVPAGDAAAFYTNEFIDKAKGVMRFEPHRAVLLAVDLQRAFCAPGGSMAAQGRDIAAMARAAAAGLGLAAAARAAGVPVVWTRMAYAADYRDGGLLIHELRPNLARIGALRRGTADADLVDGAPGPDDLVLDKTRFSAFIGTGLYGHLARLGRDTLLVCGVTTSMCVETTVRDAGQRDLPTFVVAEACGDFDADRHAAALAAMAFGFARVISLAQAGAALAAPATDFPGAP